MAVKTKVKLKFDGINRAISKGIIDSKTAGFLGQTIIGEMRAMISIGLSPVKGVGRFEGYKASRASQEVKQFVSNVRSDQGGYYRKLSRKLLTSKNFYPNSVKYKYPSKGVRPVNLDLTGKFLDTLGYRRRKNGIELGHLSPDQRTRDLFKTHNEGLNKNVPKRKYLPNKRGDEFLVSIMRLIKEIISDRLRDVIKGK